VRIIGGRLKGRVLEAPASRDIRPTADRLRESLFNILAHAHGDPVPGARVIDLFAGTGALGFEALSRGAAHALFVEHGAEARALIRANLENLGVAGLSRIFRRDATKLGDIAVEPFGLAFLDPPYGKNLAAQTLASLRDGGWLTPDALCVVEETQAENLGAPSGFVEVDRRTAGAAQLAFFRFVGLGSSERLES
jgi:16S rRNA (guanine966-N2)-methyltransferase